VVGLVAALVDSTFLWDMVSMGTLTAFMVVSIAVPVMRKKHGEATTKGFRVPFGPYLVPGLSVAACLYIMHGLSNTTYMVFSIVMALALLTYFGYSMRPATTHSFSAGRAASRRRWPSTSIAL
jgi:APA family basic amino acid/polyamine antiporter